MQKTTFKLSLLQLFVFLFFISCNDSSQQNGTNTNVQPEDSAVKTAATVGQEVRLLGTGEFSHLAILKTELDRIFGPPPNGLNARKIVFRFSHNGDVNSNVVIEGFVTNPANNNYRAGVLVTFEELQVSSSFVSQRIYLSDLELSRTKYSGLPPAGANTHLIFTPKRITSGNNINCITYQLDWGNAATFTKGQITIVLAGDELNPSPPADPN